MKRLLLTVVTGLVILAGATTPAAGQEIGDAAKAELEIIDADASA